MMGKHSGVSTKNSEEQPKAIATHCQGHSDEFFDQRMFYSAKHYGDSWGNLRLREVFSKTREKNAPQANIKCRRDIRS